MRRILSVLLWSALAITFAWIVAHLPGRVNATVGRYTMEVGVPVAVTAMLLIFLILYLLFRLFALVLRLPRHGSVWRLGRRQRAGDLAVTRALVALAAGEKADARREAARARSFLGDTPQTLLLAAEAGRLAGREDEAIASLRALASRKDAAFLGLRGLLSSAIARQDWAEATAIARQAEAAHPGAAWLRQERSQLAIRANDWAEALNLTPSDGPRAALATGAAQVEGNPERAERLARQALKVDPSFTPAVLTLAALLRLRGKEKQAQSALADGWKQTPHPDIAAMALATVSDRLARVHAAKDLVAGQPDHPESHFLLARTALDSGMAPAARRSLEAARNAGLNQRRAWLLLAEIEETEHGDTESGRIAQRDALRRAASADPDPEWRCTSCNTPQATWRPACPVCLAPGSLTWTVETWHGDAKTEMVRQEV